MFVDLPSEGFEIRSSKHLLCLLPHCLHMARPFHKLLGSFNLPNNPVKQELQNPFDKNGKWGSGNWRPGPRAQSCRNFQASSLSCCVLASAVQSGFPLEKESLHEMLFVNHSLQTFTRGTACPVRTLQCFCHLPYLFMGFQLEETETWGRTTAAGGGGEKAVAPVANGPGESSAATGGVPEEMSGAAEKEAAGGSWERAGERCPLSATPLSGTEIFLSSRVFNWILPSYSYPRSQCEAL